VNFDKEIKILKFFFI